MIACVTQNSESELNVSKLSLKQFLIAHFIVVFIQLKTGGTDTRSGLSLSYTTLAEHMYYGHQFFPHLARFQTPLKGKWFILIH